MLKNILLVFLGGGFGSVIRYLISKIDFASNYYPYNTLAVNIIGSLMLGVIIGYFLKNENINSNYLIFFTTGFCGGFTTFSAFANESLKMLTEGELVSFFSYLFFSIFFGICAVFLGFYISK